MATMLLRLSRVVLAVTLFLLAAPPRLLAQAVEGRVKSDHVSIWNPGFTTVATTVNTGETLEIVGQQGTWYEVVVPATDRQPRRTGFIARSRVDIVRGTAPAARAQDRGRTGSPTPSGRPAARPFWRLFGEAAYGRFTAAKTFEAVLGSAGGPWFGGGVMRQHASGLFIQAEAQHFSATGERVFVNNGTVYPLGVTDTVSITPVMGAIGARKAYGRRGLTLYGGAGAGVYLMRETSEFSDPADDVKQTNGAYRGLAGVEWPLSRALAAAAEFTYTFVPNSLTGNTADAFDEHDLGGMQVQIKILFGRH